MTLGQDAANVIEVRGVTKRFPGVIANQGVDITIRGGTVHALIGENGAGKSTLMKILYGVQKPDDGTLAVNGKQVSFSSPSDAIEAGIGMVFQHFMLADNLTVLENVVLGAEKLHGIGAEARQEIRSISDTYGFDLDPDQLVEELGVGARQRVEILKVLYRGAKIIILDEPTAVLVPQEVDALFENLRGLRESGRTLLFISHKLDEVLAIADDITVMRRGRTVGEAKPEGTTKHQLAELMVGSELPSPETEKSTVTDQVLLDVSGLTLVDPRGRALLLRHRPDHPPGGGPRDRGCGGQRAGGAGRDVDRTASADLRHHPAERSRHHPHLDAGPPGRRASGSSPRTGSARACCSAPRSGRTACSATRPSSRARRARGSTGRAPGPTPSGSWPSTTYGRPASTPRAAPCREETSRSSSSAAR